MLPSCRLDDNDNNASASPFHTSATAYVSSTDANRRSNTLVLAAHQYLIHNRRQRRCVIKHGLDIKPGLELYWHCVLDDSFNSSSTKHCSNNVCKPCGDAHCAGYHNGIS